MHFEFLKHLVYPFLNYPSCSNYFVYSLSRTRLKQCRLSSDTLESDNASTASGSFECPVHQADEGVDSDSEPSPELLRLMEQEAKEIVPHKEPIELINLGTEDEKREVKIGTFLKDCERVKLVKLLHDYSDIFAWSY